MKKRTPTILLALAVLALLLVLIPLTGSNPDSDGNTPETLRGAQAKPVGGSNEPESPTRRHQGDPEAGLHKGSEPAHAEQYGSKVTADIQAGETLVMGGYKLPNGSHEFTFITPSAITLEDGSTAIRLKTMGMGIGPEAAREAGLNTLTTGYRKADQHAEAWSAEDVRSTLAKSSTEASHMLTSPIIVIKPGETATISMGGENGQAFHSIEATANFNEQGGFSIQSQVIRNPQSP